MSASQASESYRAQVFGWKTLGNPWERVGLSLHAADGLAFVLILAMHRPNFTAPQPISAGIKSTKLPGTVAQIATNSLANPRTVTLGLE